MTLNVLCGFYVLGSMFDFKGFYKRNQLTSLLNNYLSTVKQIKILA
jgi:hypothetical protein